jgi:AraC-like DNA-binding protein
LANDQMKIKQVAAALGFDSPANFGKAFKRWHGVSPGNFRSARIPDRREPSIMHNGSTIDDLHGAAIH